MRQAICRVVTNYDGEYLVETSHGELLAPSLEAAVDALALRGGQDLVDEFFTVPLSAILTYSLRS